MEAFLDWNLEILRAIAQLRGPVCDVIFSLFTALGEETVLIVVLCALYWCVDKRLAYVTGIVYFSTSTVASSMKMLFHIPRPWLLDPGFSIVESARAGAGGYSFPSGHTQTASALYGTVGFWVKNKAIKAVCFVLVALVGFSRMYLGVHTPLDVVVSWVFVLATAFVLVRLFTTRPDSTRRDAVCTAVVCALALGTAALAIGYAARSLVDAPTAANYCRDAAAAIGFALGAFVERRYIRFETATRRLWMQFAKFALGFAGVLAVKEGLKLVIGTSYACNALRYFLLVAWVAAVYPLVVKKLFPPPAAKKEAAPV